MLYKEDKVIDQSLKVFERNSNMDRRWVLVEVLVYSSRWVVLATKYHVNKKLRRIDGLTNGGGSVVGVDVLDTNFVSLR